MKILEEPLLLNNLQETLNLLDDEATILIKRGDRKAVVLMDLDTYNEMNATIYRAKKVTVDEN